MSIAVQLEDGHEGLGRHLDGTEVPHLLLALFLLFQQFLFAGFIINRYIRGQFVWMEYGFSESLFTGRRFDQAYR